MMTAFESFDRFDCTGGLPHQALTDRFVEAFAEKLHEDIRKEIWGYAPDEKVRSHQGSREKRTFDRGTASHLRHTLLSCLRRQQRCT